MSEGVGSTSSDEKSVGKTTFSDGVYEERKNIEKKCPGLKLCFLLKRATLTAFPLCKPD